MSSEDPSCATQPGTVAALRLFCNLYPSAICAAYHLYRCSQLTSIIIQQRADSAANCNSTICVSIKKQKVQALGPVGCFCLDRLCSPPTFIPQVSLEVHSLVKTSGHRVKLHLPTSCHKGTVLAADVQRSLCWLGKLAQHSQLLQTSSG